MPLHPASGRPSVDSASGKYPKPVDDSSRSRSQYRSWFRATLKHAQHTWRTLKYLRHALGLRIFDLTNKPESPSKVLRKSRWIAFVQCIVHLVPSAVFAVLLGMNFKTYFIGGGFSVNDEWDQVYFALFQVAAKVQELLCIASLSAILLQILRNEILFADGLPLGFLSSHFWFTSPASLLSGDYWSPTWQSIRSIYKRLHPDSTATDRATTSVNWRQIRLAILVPILVFLATLIGPFAAVLMIPRTQTFSAGGSDYFLSATADELWPNVMETSPVGLETPECWLSDATLYPVCPSGGYDDVKLRTAIYSTDFREGLLLPEYYLVLDNNGIMPAVLSSGLNRDGSTTGTTFFCQPHAYTVIIAESLVTDWYSATGNPPDWSGGPFDSLAEYQFAAKVDVTTISTVPLTFVQCAAPQELVRDDVVLGFPYIQSQPLFPTGWSTDLRPVDISHIKRNSSDHLRTQWLALDEEDFGPVSSGVVFEMPWSAEAGKRLVTACTIASFWASAPIKRLNGGAIAWQAQVDFDLVGAFIAKSDVTPSAALSPNTGRRIKFTPEWLEILSPEAPDPPQNSTWRPSTLENAFAAAGWDDLLSDLRSHEVLFKDWHGGCDLGYLDANATDYELWNTDLCNTGNRTSSIEALLARFVTDGLSRRLSFRAFDHRPPLPDWFISYPRAIDGSHSYGRRLLEGSPSAVNMSFANADTVNQTFTVHAHGLGYRISSAADYVAVAVAALYLLFALIHTIWTISRGVTSNSWDTVTELLLLAFNSPRASQLHDTSAAVSARSTYRHQMVVRAAYKTSNTGPHAPMRLELLVTEDDQDHRFTHKTVEHDKKYS